LFSTFTIPHFRNTTETHCYKYVCFCPATTFAPFSICTPSLYAWGAVCLRTQTIGDVHPHMLLYLLGNNNVCSQTKSSCQINKSNVLFTLEVTTLLSIDQLIVNQQGTEQRWQQPTYHTVLCRPATTNGFTKFLPIQSVYVNVLQVLFPLIQIHQTAFITESVCYMVVDRAILTDDLLYSMDKQSIYQSSVIFCRYIFT
jgi:hypothetical protein